MNAPPKTVPPLGSREVHVWQMSLLAESRAVLEGWDILSVDEKRRAEKFAMPELRRRFVMARAMLRHLLGHYAGRHSEEVTFIYGQNGKPTLTDGGWHFNVSHSGELALIAVATGGAVGVDVEQVRELDYLAVGRGILAESDLRVLADGDDKARRSNFFRLWVRNEAQVKAVGGTLGTRADVPVHDVDVGGSYRAALATAIKEPRIELLNC